MISRKQNEMIFSIIFFFFASFLFIGIIATHAVSNFDNLLPIMLKPNGFFVMLARIVLFLGFCVAIFDFFTRKKVRNRLYTNWTIFAAVLFASLLGVSILSNFVGNELDKMVNIYTYNDASDIVRNVKKIVIDSVVFVYFVLIPIVGFFYRRRIYDSYFYQTYLRDVAPSMNTSIFFLFGFSVESYSLNPRPIVDCALSVICILLFLRIAISLRKTISLYSVTNLLVLIVGFALFLYSHEVLARGNFYYVGIFFYTIGLLYWYLNIAIKLRG